MVKKIQTLTILIILGLLNYFLTKHLLLESSDLVLIVAGIFSLVMLSITLFILLDVLITRHMMPVGKSFIPIRRKVKIYNTIVEDKEGMIYKFEGEYIYDTFKVGDSAKITIIEYKIGQEIFTTERTLTYNGNYNK